MKKKLKTSTSLLIMGLLGITGVLLTLASDFILIGRPGSSYSFFKLGTESMADLSQWRITTGAFLGVFVIPIQIAGLGTVYHGLKPAGKINSLIVVITSAHSLIMAVAFHISYAFIASGWKLYYEMDYEDLIAENILRRFDFYWRIVIIIMAVEVVFSSIVFTFLILRKNTLYPKWMALFNPLCVLFYMFILIVFIPHPIGGFVAPAFLNFSTLVFLILSTVTVYSRSV